jgi:hypothetical protein
VNQEDYKLAKRFDFDGNGSVDLTISGNGRTSFTTSMFVTQHGSNQVWSVAEGFAGLDFGSHALALLGGSTLGSGLYSENPMVGWHNEDDTQGFSILMEAISGSPVSGTFFPRTLFEQKYLGFRFERDGGSIMAGWRYPPMLFTGMRFMFTPGPTRVSLTGPWWWVRSRSLRCRRWWDLEQGSQ